MEAKPENPKYHRQAKWRDANPQKVWAQAALRSAVKRGLLAPAPCEDCGSPDAEAHHDDYNKPMAVRWLCRRHHKAAHRAMRCE